MNLVCHLDDGKKIWYELRPFDDLFYMIDTALYLNHKIDDDSYKSVFIPGDYREGAAQRLNTAMVGEGAAHPEDFELYRHYAPEDQWSELIDFMNQYSNGSSRWGTAYGEDHIENHIETDDGTGNGFVHAVPPTIYDYEHMYTTNTNTVTHTATTTAGTGYWRIY